MGILEKLFTPTSTQAAAWPADDDRWYMPLTAASFTGSGAGVTDESAMKVSAVYRATKIIAESVATLPLVIYERTASGKDRAMNHPLYDVLHTQPNDYMDAVEFREYCQTSLLHHGNAYALRLGGPRGSTDQLRPLDPNRMTVRRMSNNTTIYRYTVPQTGGYVDYSEDEIFHVRNGIGPDGLTGVSIIRKAAESIGIGIMTEQYAARVFSQRGELGGVLEYPAELSPRARENLRDAWQQSHAGPENWHRIAVLEEGMTFRPITMNPEDAQLLASRQYTVTDIARWFGVQPHLLMDLSRSTNNNIEHQGIEFVSYTLRPWLVRWEQAINRQLISANRRFFAEHIVEGLLRGDSLTRNRAYSMALNAGWMTPNEVRERENMNRLDGLDSPRFPLNTAPAGSDAATGDRAMLEEPAYMAEVPEPAIDSMEHSIARTFAREQAGRILRRELTQLNKAHRRSSSADEFMAEAHEIYAEHKKFLTDQKIDDALAESWCRAQIDALDWSGFNGAKEWTNSRIDDLTDLLISNAQSLLESKEDR